MKIEGVVRLSAAKDVRRIMELISSRFTPTTDYLKGIVDGRYFVFDAKGYGILAVTGLIWNEGMNACEVDYTCTDKDFEGRGIMGILFKKMLASMDTLLYCSYWKLMDKEEPNLHVLMGRHGFVPVLHGVKSYLHGMNCKTQCPEYCGSWCECREDLYLRKGEGNAGYGYLLGRGQDGRYHIWQDDKDMASVDVVPYHGGIAIKDFMSTGMENYWLKVFVNRLLETFNCEVAVFARNRMKEGDGDILSGMADVVACGIEEYRAGINCDGLGCGGTCFGKCRMDFYKVKERALSLPEKGE